MVKKDYDWSSGAVLQEHSRRKHKILREYFFSYVLTRCQLPRQEQFRLAVVDGFSGAGRYSRGEAGSPLIVLEELERAIDAINTKRTASDLPSISIQCLLVLNDATPGVTGLLQENLAPLLQHLRTERDQLQVRVEYLTEEFEAAYPRIRASLQSNRFKSVLFNLDQCGHSSVQKSTIIDIMRSFPAAEIFYTFAIESLIAFLQQSNPDLVARRLRHLNLAAKDVATLGEMASRNEWLGSAERIVFEAFFDAAPFVSPFSINNPAGWRYWLIHFANSYRARQVYNNILHANSSAQAHFGRSGLNMLSYDPAQDGELYLFDKTGRASAVGTLHDDIPRLIAEWGDAMGVQDFYETAYNATPAHADDIHTAIIENPDIEVITPGGGQRRSARSIAVGDVLKLRAQKSFFPLLNLPITKKSERE